jgi:hypothetical protein
MSPILTGVIASGISGNLTPPWSPEGAYDSLATVTVPSGGLASVTFAGIPTGYKHLQLRMSNTVGATIRFNGDTTTSNYRYHVLVGTGTNAIAATTANNAYSPAGGTTGTTVEILDILDYANTSKNKTLRSLGGFGDVSTGEAYITSNLWMSTAAINSITMTASFPQNSQFSLYGVK